MDEQLLIKLISYIESASPELWRIANQQVEVGVFQNLIHASGWTLSLIICIVVFVLSIRGYGKTSDSNHESGFFVVALLAVIAGIPLFVFSLDAWVNYFSMQLNPEYYAIKFIIELLQSNQ